MGGGGWYARRGEAEQLRCNNSIRGQARSRRQSTSRPENVGSLSSAPLHRSDRDDVFIMGTLPSDTAVFTSQRRLSGLKY